MFDELVKSFEAKVIHSFGSVHPRQQTLCYLKTETGELVISEAPAQRASARLYQQFQGAVVGKAIERRFEVGFCFKKLEVVLGGGQYTRGSECVSVFTDLGDVANR